MSGKVVAEGGDGSQASQSLTPIASDNDSSRTPKTAINRLNSFACWYTIAFCCQADYRRKFQQYHGSYHRFIWRIRKRLLGLGNTADPCFRALFRPCPVAIQAFSSQPNSLYVRGIHNPDPRPTERSDKPCKRGLAAAGPTGSTFGNGHRTWDNNHQCCRNRSFVGSSSRTCRGGGRGNPGDNSYCSPAY